MSSEPGEGAAFTIYLPLVDAAADDDADRTAAKLPPSGGEGRFVLVVEDNAAVGEFSTELLHDLGYATHWVTSAADALAVLKQDPTRFNLVFSDVVMAGMNGLELASRIRAKYPNLPVVLTSGYSEVLAQEGHRGFELIQKPYSVEALSRVLHQAIEKGLIA